ncbi:MAG: thioredoxin domain-containing protein [Candidatus Nomurabacteria bacterium]|nr:MAG: thioredoxin domain-containing protein [Candidatus Nomurabacteria bacterium]
MNDNTEQQLTKKQRRELRRQEKMANREKGAQSARMKKLIWTVIILVVVVGGGIWAFQGSDNTSTAGDFSNDNDPSRGPETAKVLIEEYSDFQCPACKAADTNLPEVLAAYPNDVRFVYNDYPLTTIHKNARAAAEAAQCAFAQGKFWEYHDKLFEEQASWSVLSGSTVTDTFVQYASDLGIDSEAFQSCIDNTEQKEAVNTDIGEGNARKVNSTPTFFINGERRVGGMTTDNWKSVIDAAIAEADATASTDQSEVNANN